MLWFILFGSAGEEQCFRWESGKMGFNDCINMTMSSKSLILLAIKSPFTSLTRRPIKYAKVDTYPKIEYHVTSQHCPHSDDYLPSRSLFNLSFLAFLSLSSLSANSSSLLAILIALCSSSSTSLNPASISSDSESE